MRIYEINLNDIQLETVKKALLLQEELNTGNYKYLINNENSPLLWKQENKNERLNTIFEYFNHIGSISKRTIISSPLDVIDLLNDSKSLSEGNVNIIMSALDVYGRLASGQFIELITGNNSLPNLYNEESEKIESLIHESKSILFPELSGMGHNYGIKNKELNEETRIGYDIRQVLRHRISWDNEPTGGFQVSFDKPWKTATNTELATITQI